MLDVLAPRRCALCRRSGSGLCGDCAAVLPAAPPLPPPPGLDRCWALLAYDGPTRQLVAELKFRNHRDAIEVVTRALTVFVSRSTCPVDVITWAPTSPGRRRRRGYDQAELLARAVGRHAGVATAALLERRRGAAQTGADREHRLDGPEFRGLGTTATRGHAVVVDDVWTTGATLSAAAQVLRGDGAEQVSGLVLAVRP